MDKRIKKELQYLLPLLISASTFMVFRSLPIIERAWLMNIVMLGILVMFVPKYFKNKHFILILMYIMVLFGNVVSGDKQFSNLITAFNDFMYLCIPSGITYYLLTKHDVLSITRTVTIFLFFLVQTSVVSFYFNMGAPGIIRFIATMNYTDGDTSQFNVFFRFGLSNYYLPHALPALLPPIYVGMTNVNLKNIIRFLLLICLLSVLLLVYLSGATTALLLSLICVFALLLTKRTRFSKNITKLSVVLFFGLFLIVNSDFVMQTLNIAEEVMGEGDYAGKISDFQESMTYGSLGGDAGARSDLYNKSYTELASNFFIGTNEKVGGHSALLDRFACLGIVGFIPLFLVFYYQIKFVRRFLDENYYTYYYIGVAMAIGMMFLKNMLNWEMMIILFTILPVSMVLFGKEKQNIA